MIAFTNVSKELDFHSSFHTLAQTYEARIDALQKQVEEQSMTMSMYSSYSPEDFHQEEDIFGKRSCTRTK